MPVRSKHHAKQKKPIQWTDDSFLKALANAFVDGTPPSELTEPMMPLPPELLFPAAHLKLSDLISGNDPKQIKYAAEAYQDSTAECAIIAEALIASRLPGSDSTRKAIVAGLGVFTLRKEQRLRVARPIFAQALFRIKGGLRWTDEEIFEAAVEGVSRLFGSYVALDTLKTDYKRIIGLTARNDQGALDDAFAKRLQERGEPDAALAVCFWTSRITNSSWADDVCMLCEHYINESRFPARRF